MMYPINVYFFVLLGIIISLIAILAWIVISGLKRVRKRRKNNTRLRNERTMTVIVELRIEKESL